LKKSKRAYVYSSSSVLVDGSTSISFNPSCGIKQGDTLSPFLFILMMEGFGRNLQHDIASGSLKDFKLHSDVSPISHLQFVDDIMPMVHPSTKEASSIKANLDSFLLAFETMINHDTSLFIF
jgi:hypothetical protein